MIIGPALTPSSKMLSPKPGSGQIEMIRIEANLGEEVRNGSSVPSPIRTHQSLGCRRYLLALHTKHKEIIEISNF